MQVGNNSIANNLTGNFCGRVPNGKIDYSYKRCYTDNQGNFVNPRTSWDELLKLLSSLGDAPDVRGR